MTSDLALLNHATCPHCALAVNIEHILDNARKELAEEVLNLIHDTRLPLEEVTRRLRTLIADASLSLQEARHNTHPIRMLRGNA